MIDLQAAAQFIASYARLLERRRFACIEGDGRSEAVLRVLRAYRNADGGIGHLEPDIRAPASQPVCVRYALEIMHETGEADRELATDALDWIQAVSSDDGGVRGVLPSAAGWPHAPWFRPEEPSGSSLLMTAGIAAMALRLGIDHPWLAPAVAFCWERIADLDPQDGPYTVRYTLDFLDAAPDRARADAELERIGALMPADGVLGFSSGGNEGEVIRPLELAPWPEHAAARVFAGGVIERELDRLEAEQQDDGGWKFSWLAWNPVQSWEWRGVVTIEALRALKAYGRLGPATG